VTSHPPPATSPVDPGQRIDALDILRGAALLGMLIVHFHDRSTAPGGIDDVVRTLIWRLIESKSHGTFALLFGAGFAIQLRRAEAQGRPFVAIYLRRLLVLACFGFAAHAFFGFNVLLGYAVWGVSLLLIRSWSTRTLLVTAALSSASVGLYYLARMLYLQPTMGSEAFEAAEQARLAFADSVDAALHAAEAQPSYLVLLAARLRHMAWFYRQPFFFMPSATVTLFITGFLLIRHGVFENPRAHRGVLKAMVAFGIVSWAADNWLLPFSFGLLRDQWLTFAYVAGALLLLSHVAYATKARRHEETHAGLRAVREGLRIVGNAGRLALTNYLIQIAALDLLFSGYALHLDKIRPIVGPPLALAFFAVEAAFSTIWLRHFRFGPAEWLWRSLTYGRRQPMRGHEEHEDTKNTKNYSLHGRHEDTESAKT
jgi:uncharacterized protein